MNPILKVCLSFVIVTIALLPTWFWLFLKNALNPEGFWQNFMIYGLGIYFLGALQIGLLVIAVFAIIYFILAD